METKEAEKITEEFFKIRFPDKNIAFEKRCGYFGEWVERFKSGHPEVYMDNISMKIWKEMLEELTSKQEDFFLEQARESNYERKEAKE